MATKTPGLWKSSFGEIVETIKVLEANGVTLEHLARLRSDKQFAQTVGEFIVEQSEWESLGDLPTVGDMIFSLEVDYDRSIEDGQKAGDYDFFNSHITSQNFLKVREGKMNVDIHLVNFNCVIPSTEDVVNKLGELDLCPASVYELLALGEIHPNLQWEFQIVALGSIIFDPTCPDDEVSVPYLTRHSVRRGVDIARFGNEWPIGCRFLAVPK